MQKRGVGAAVFAAFALGLAGSPVVADASPFASYSSAAADQYQSSNGSGGGANGNANGNSASGGNANGNAAKTHKHGSSSSHQNASGVSGQSPSGSNASSGVSGAHVGVAPSTHPIKTHGTLPFTGLSLTTLVLVALALLGAGLSFRAAERLHRRRRATAPS